MRRDSGLSLIELSAVVAILGIIALVMVPDLSSTDAQKVQLAAQRVAEALRFARSEALRTGEHHGVTISQVTQDVMVKKWDLTTDPVSTDSIPYDPLSKHPFQFGVDRFVLAPGVRITNSSDIFLFADTGRRRSLIFDPQGAPLWILGGDGSAYRLVEGKVMLSAGQAQRTVSVAPVTGLATIQ
jgi:prepilin-type N-terminal cleavage/methylation domain-containing protein